MNYLEHWYPPRSTNPQAVEKKTKEREKIKTQANGDDRLGSREVGCSKLVSWATWGRKQLTREWENKGLERLLMSPFSFLERLVSAVTMISGAGKPNNCTLRKWDQLVCGYSLLVFLKDQGLNDNLRNVAFRVPSECFCGMGVETMDPWCLRVPHLKGIHPPQGEFLKSYADLDVALLISQTWPNSPEQ